MTLEPTTQQFVDQVAGEPALQTLSLAQGRAFLARLQSAPVGKPSVQITDIAVPPGPGGPLQLRCIRPRDADHALPVIIHVLGGGGGFGDAVTHDRLMREIAVGVGAALISIADVPSRYPAAVEGAYAALQHVVANAAALGVDATRLALMGDGVGGTIAAAVALLAKARRGPAVDLQVLFYPATAARCDSDSYAVFADGPWLTRAAMQQFWDACLPDTAQRADITASPLGASIDQLRNLPDTLLIMAENDVLRDEGECYARKLSDAGVRVTSVRYNGTIHDFVMLNALADTPAARGAIAQAICALKAALG